MHDDLIVEYDIDRLDDEAVDVTSARLAGPVDPPARRATFQDVTSAEQRPPIVPAWVRSKSQRAQAAQWAVRFGGYLVAFHIARSPKYAAKTALWAPWGLVQAVYRAGRWASAEQGNWALRQHAATRGDADTWLKLDHARRRSAAWRWWVFGAGFLAAAALGALLLSPLFPLPVRVAAWGLAVFALAWVGRPADRPITDRTTITPRFTRLTAEMVRAALCSIGIAGIKEQAQVTFPPPGIHRDGPGWLARVNLPAGVEAVDVMERRGRVSSALRLPVDQVWPSAGPDHAGQLDLWVGYLPSSRMGQPLWSLCADNARTSVFDAHEFGTDERQRPVLTALFARNFLIGGVPGSGKSYAARTLATIALLDPTAELKIVEYKGTGDFTDFAPLCSTYACGVNDAEFEVGMQMLTWGLAEAERRAKRLLAAKQRGEAPEGKVTPELARRPGSGLHPVVMVFDEVHELFGDAELGKAAAIAAERLIKRGRALGLIIILATQIPDRTSLPPNITRCVTVRWCLAVQDQVANDMILGTGAYKRGLTATVYRPGIDAGWGIVTGIETAGPVRSHYPKPEVAAAIVARATYLRGGVVGDGGEPAQVRDLLDDVVRVWSHWGQANIHWPDLAGLLAGHFPEAYAGLSADAVSTLMRDRGVESKPVSVAGKLLRGCTRSAVEEAWEAAVEARSLPSGDQP
jgi:DNA segregation ATPase FtsK/SpoIIIE, S-DNA-T family